MNIAKIQVKHFFALGEHCGSILEPDALHTPKNILLNMNYIWYLISTAKIILQKKYLYVHCTGQINFLR